MGGQCTHWRDIHSSLIRVGVFVHLCPLDGVLLVPMFSVVFSLRTKTLTSPARTHPLHSRVHLKHRYFEGDENDAGRTILSTLPMFLNHNFMIRTSDNVGVDMFLRISYQIREINIFWKNPIQFVPYIQNYVQDEFLDRFARISLRDFMATFTAEAIASIEMVDGYVSKKKV